MWMLTFGICIFIFFIDHLHAQYDSVSFKLPVLKITQLEKGKNIVRKFENSPNMFFLKGSLLVADPKKYDYSVDVNNVKKIAIYKGTSFWQGAGIGAAIGFVGGFIFGAFIMGEYGGGSKKGGVDGGMMFGFMGVVPAAIIGGVAGLFIPRYCEYSLPSYSGSLSEKIRNLEDALDENKIR
jgi:hypothetical protein